MILMALFLLLPDRRRLVQFCFQDCAVKGPVTRRLCDGARANRISLAAQIVFGLCLLGTALHGASQDWFKYGGGAPKPPLYGIWNVDEMRIDGVVRAPLLTDYERWRRVVFEFPEWMSFQRMDDSFGGFGATFDAKRGILTLKQPADQKWKVNSLSVVRAPVASP